MRRRKASYLPPKPRRVPPRRQHLPPSPRPRLDRPPQISPSPTTAQPTGAAGLQRGLQYEAQTWAMLQNRLDPRIHARTMGATPTDSASAFGMLGFGMPDADASSFVLNAATIPKALAPKSPPVSSPAPAREISEKRKQWLAQLMEKKRRAAERKAAIARGEPDPFAPAPAIAEHNEGSDAAVFAGDQTKSSGKSGRRRSRKKRQPDEMSNSECESDLEQAGVVKFRRTSRGSKVDSSSEVSDVEGTTPRSNSSRRRRGRNTKGRRSRRRGSKGGGAETGSGGTSEQSSGDLDEVFGKLHVDSNSSGGELPQTYTIDHLSFLEDSQNTHRNKGRIGSSDLGASMNMRGLGTSMRLDASLGQSLDDSVRFWEAETSAAQQDLQSFVNGFTANEDVETNDDGGGGSRRPADGLPANSVGKKVVPVVSSLFGVGGLEPDGEDDQLEKSWMIATDPQAMSANGMDMSMMKSFDRSRKSPLPGESTMIMKSFDEKRKSPVPGESINLGISTTGMAAAAAAIFKDDELEESI